MADDSFDFYKPVTASKPPASTAPATSPGAGRVANAGHAFDFYTPIGTTNPATGKIPNPAAPDSGPATTPSGFSETHPTLAAGLTLGAGAVGAAAPELLLGEEAVSGIAGMVARSAGAALTGTGASVGAETASTGKLPDKTDIATQFGLGLVFGLGGEASLKGLQNASGKYAAERVMVENAGAPKTPTSLKIAQANKRAVDFDAQYDTNLAKAQADSERDTMAAHVENLRKEGYTPAQIDEWTTSANKALAAGDKMRGALKAIDRVNGDKFNKRYGAVMATEGKTAADLGPVNAAVQQAKANLPPNSPAAKVLDVYAEATAPLAPPPPATGRPGGPDTFETYKEAPLTPGNVQGAGAGKGIYARYVDDQGNVVQAPGRVQGRQIVDPVHGTKADVDPDRLVTGNTVEDLWKLRKGIRAKMRSTSDPAALGAYRTLERGYTAAMQAKMTPDGARALQAIDKDYGDWAPVRDKLQDYWTGKETVDKMADGVFDIVKRDPGQLNMMMDYAKNAMAVDPTVRPALKGSLLKYIENEAEDTSAVKAAGKRTALAGLFGKKAPEMMSMLFEKDSPFRDPSKLEAVVHNAADPRMQEKLLQTMTKANQARFGDMQPVPRFLLHYAPFMAGFVGATGTTMWSAFSNKKIQGRLMETLAKGFAAGILTGTVVQAGIMGGKAATNRAMYEFYTRPTNVQAAAKYVDALGAAAAETAAPAQSGQQ